MVDLFDDHPVPLREQLADAERELHLRLSVYPRRVSAGKMTQAQAERQIRVQRAIIATLRALADPAHGVPADAPIVATGG